MKIKLHNLHEALNNFHVHGHYLKYTSFHLTDLKRQQLSFLIKVNCNTLFKLSTFLNAYVKVRLRQHANYCSQILCTVLAIIFKSKIKSQ